MPRQAIGLGVALAAFLAACGGSSMTLEEYVDQMQTSTDELEALGVQFNAVMETAIDSETGTVVEVDAMQGLLDETVVALEEYFDELGGFEAPSEVEDAHNAFVAVAAARLAQWQSAADRIAEIQSVDELRDITLKSSEFTDVCMALEQSVDDNGLELDLDCD